MSQLIMRNGACQVFFYLHLELQLVSYSLCFPHRLDQLKPDWHWQIESSGRIAHRKSYIEDTAKDHSLSVVLYEKLDSFRTEKGVGVRGHFFVLKKGNNGKDEL